MSAATKTTDPIRGRRRARAPLRRHVPTAPQHHRSAGVRDPCSRDRRGLFALLAVVVRAHSAAAASRQGGEGEDRDLGAGNQRPGGPARRGRGVWIGPGCHVGCRRGDQRRGDGERESNGAVAGTEQNRSARNSWRAHATGRAPNGQRLPPKSSAGAFVACRGSPSHIATTRSVSRRPEEE